MTVDEFVRAYLLIASELFPLMIIGAFIVLGITLVKVLRRYRQMTEPLLEPEKLKAKPKRTGEKLKRGDGEVLDIINEEPKNDANHHRVS